MLTAVEAHHDLIDQLVARGALWSPALLAAFRATPRHFFLQRVWSNRDNRWHHVDYRTADEDSLRLIYADRAITTRLSDDSGEAPVAISSSSQPSLMAQMLEDLDLAPDQRLLEIGAGTGYNAALIARVIGAVTSLDVDRAVLADAARHLAQLPDRQVHLVHADGRAGHAAGAPYDRIQCTAASADLEPAWLEQLAPGGLLQVPLDLAPGLAWLMQGEAPDGVFRGRLTRAAFFMPLRDEGDPGRDRNVPDAPLPHPERLHARPAPYAAWHDRRGFDLTHDLLPALALFAWLQGHTVAYTSGPDHHPAYGVADLVRGEACWLGAQEWRVSGKGGLELGWRLWREWLDLGGPRPHEWRLQASPDAARLTPSPAARLACPQRGPRCARLWELIEPRHRLGEP